MGDPLVVMLDSVAGRKFQPRMAWAPAAITAADSRTGRVRLVVDGDVVEAAAPQASHALDLLPPPLHRMACLVPLDESTAELRVWSFQETCSLGEQPLTLALDDAVLRTIADDLGTAVDATTAVEWIHDEFLLPWLDPGTSALAAFTSRGLAGRTLNVVGARHVLDVDLSDGHAEATRLRPRRGSSTGPSSVLVVGRVQVTTSVTPSGGATVIDTVLSGSGYADRWRRYDDVEREATLEAAARLGTAAFRATDLDGGTWRIALDRGAEDFLELVDGGTELEVVSADSAAATPVTVVEVGDSWLKVASIDSSVTLPATGHVRAAQAGAAASSRRRQDAIRLIEARSTGMPELRDLLDLRPVPPRRVERRLRWSSPAVREIFGVEGPTEAQKRAIEVALNTPDIALIQGPPGTGKTKVIAAIATRVVEELGETAASGQVVLASHQHDAVDNMIGRTIIFGLPPRKHERSRRGPQPWVHQWREDRLAAARSLLTSSSTGRAARLRDEVDAVLLTYHQAPPPAADVPELLDRVLTTCSGMAGADVLREVDLLRARISVEVGATAAERDLALVAAVRSLRTTSAGHADDGRMNARRTKARLARSPINVEGASDVLDEVASTHHPDAALLERLALLKGRVLDLLAPMDARAHVRAVRDDVSKALVALSDDLRARVDRDDASLSGVLLDLVSDLESDPSSVERAMATYAPTVAATCQASADLRSLASPTGQRHTYDTVVIDEAARANPLDLQIPMALARRRLVLVGDERQLPHLLDDEIAEAVSATDAEKVEMHESLFGRLHRFLDAERRRGAPLRTVTLDSQFRMHPRLGEMVSRHFYEPGQRLRSPAPPERFTHGLDGYEDVVTQWHDVPASQGRAHQPDGRSWAREPEADAAALLARDLMEKAPHLTFGVITFYRAQVDAILAAMVDSGMCAESESGAPELLPQWRFTVDESGRSVERLRVGTVDAFQGKEFDVVVLSVVRTPGQRGGGLGHLAVPNRLCVAMSRQRRLLLVVGDRDGYADSEIVSAKVPALSEIASAGVIHGTV